MKAANELKVGAAQFSSHIGDVDANIESHLSWIEKGRGAGLDLLVLPELSLTGHYGPEQLLEAAMSRHDPRLAKLAQAAGSMAVTVGFIEEGSLCGFSLGLPSVGPVDTQAEIQRRRRHPRECW